MKSEKYSPVARLAIFVGIIIYCIAVNCLGIFGAVQIARLAGWLN